MRRILTICIVAMSGLVVPVVFFGGLASSAGATESGSSSVGLTISPTAPVLTRTASGWSTTILVANSGSCAIAVDYELLVSTHYASGPMVGVPTVSPTPPSGCALAGGTVNKVTLQFADGFTTIPSAVTLAVFGDPSDTQQTFSSPSTIQLSVQRALGLVHELVFPLILGIVFAAIFVQVCRRKIGDMDLEAGSNWSFKDSWATNITFVSALFGAIISSSSSIASAFPGVPLYRFAMLNAAYAAIAGIAPMISGFGAKPPVMVGGQPIRKLNKVSVYGAGALTLLALGGVVASLSELEWWSSAVPWARVALIAVTVGIIVPVLIFAIQSTVSLSAEPKAESVRDMGKVLGAEAFSFVATPADQRSFQSAAI